MSSAPTATATIGPFFPPRYFDAGASDLTVLNGRRAKGEAIEIVGRVIEESGAPLENLVVEIWQADANGIYDHPADPRAGEADPGFFGWGRAATNRDGVYRFRTIRPGATRTLDGRPRAPHIEVLVNFSGLMRELRTTLFFEGEPANATDPVLLAVPGDRRDRLVARREPGGAYRFDLVLRGANETPFFEL
jgi:protocatechuate 3,4-dioxygenase alpha subunit